MKKFMDISLLAIIFLFLICAAFVFLNKFSTLGMYNAILLILTAATVAVMLLFILSVAAVFYSCKENRVYKNVMWLVNLGLRMVFPIAIFLAGIFKNNRDLVRRLYIEVNNILVKSRKKRYIPEKVLMLLPHCLQNSKCIYKVTSDIGNCRKCGGCCVGELTDAAGKAGIKMRIVTGGTAARGIIERERPELVISVACERDLASGIADVSRTPVIGVLNLRPNGPCFNTTVNIDVLTKEIESVLI
ncbi:DUF116 domain-containing protein [Anaerobacterium chartisolvens]|uniref:DUF116 domain-containing protein n=1 Tax=Anaerobacterium chartisolvens TaxID=1297424 RepID=UPI001A9A4660|nr:DUF116 domain-containing protein [Anaerobacterium chartisolvens]